jgi:phosphatidylserine/phosphatidylglycerophosphate/cardiolipin synthase-like enzyme
MATSGSFAPKSIDQTVLKNLPKLRKPGVLTVRPGYEITGNQLTGRQAVVATVHTKKNKADLAAKDVLPNKIGKYPVDVREATAQQRLRAYDPAAAALTEAYGRPENREPVWPNEREMPSGKLLNAKTSQTQKAFQRSINTQPATHLALAAHQQKKQINYAPPQSAPPLSRVEVNTTIIANVSPDAGYATLSNFLAGTQQSLVIGMYDFTSGPLLKDFLAAMKGNKTLQMVLDNPSPNPTRDQTDWVTVEELNSGLGNRAEIARALVRSDAFASEWMFPYAYHIKVIVRDGDTFWLSSGNLNNSNQPDLSSPPHTEDRDWHVIIADKELAQTFAYYLNYDYTSAAACQTPNPGAIEKAIEDAQTKKASQYNPPPPAQPAAPLKDPVAAETFDNIDVAITPLLTPDDLPNGQRQYLTNIMNLIKGAKTSLHIQLQYIESSKGTGDFYEQLLQAIADKASKIEDVKLIESLDYGLKWAEKMKSVGVDLTENISLQHNVHNKGFVIDSKIAVVSSQNFSPAGVHDNRDAGVIIENAEVAQYFDKVFVSDWKNPQTKPAMAVISTKSTKGGGKAKKGKSAPAKQKVKAKTATAKGGGKAKKGKSAPAKRNVKAKTATAKKAQKKP